MSRMGREINGHSKMATLLLRLQRATRFVQPQILREMSMLASEASREGEQSISFLLEHVTTSNDLETIVKLFAVLSHAVLSNTTNYERVATCRELYEATRRVLGKGLPDKMAATLLFIASLCGGAENARDTGSAGEWRGRVARCARDHVRASGCLQLMVQLFFKDVMYAETWRALCQSLTESCRDCEDNQTICSHLVPACVERCGQDGAGSGAVLQLLLVLVERHEANRDLFLHCDGLRLFTREVLVRVEGAMLLSCIVQHPPAARRAYDAGVPQTLAQLINTHGAHTQVGQWCSIGLFHITTGLKIVSSSDIARESDEKQSDPNENDNMNVPLYDSIVQQIVNVTTNIPDEMEGNEDENVFLTDMQGCSESDFFRMTRATRKIKHFASGDGLKNNFTVAKTQTYVEPILRNDHLTEEPIKTNTLKRTQSMTNYTQTSVSGASGGPFVNRSAKVQPRLQVNKSCQTSIEETISENSAAKDAETSFFEQVTSISNFIPIATSTPIRNTKTHTHSSSRKDQCVSMQKCLHTTLRPTQQKVRRRHLNRHEPIRHKRLSDTKIMSSSKLIRDRVETVAKEKTKQSLGSKLFRSFNESCMSVIQSFKTYVLPGNSDTKNTTIVAKVNKSNGNQNGHTDTSFIQYMKNRQQHKANTTQMRCRNLDFFHIDQIMLREDSESDESEGGEGAGGACETCNDTVVLQQKLADDENLQDTVKKLKRGIYTYGCDFKKIATHFWPQDLYMTPAVLYRLYRKLIVKK